MRHCWSSGKYRFFTLFGKVEIGYDTFTLKISRHFVIKSIAYQKKLWQGNESAVYFQGLKRIYFFFFFPSVLFVLFILLRHWVHVCMQKYFFSLRSFIFVMNCGFIYKDKLFYTLSTILLSSQT